MKFSAKKIRAEVYEAPRVERVAQGFDALMASHQYKKNAVITPIARVLVFFFYAQRKKMRVVRAKQNSVARRKPCVKKTLYKNENLP